MQMSMINTEVTVRLQGQMTKLFWMTQGLKQGDGYKLDQTEGDTAN